MKHKKTLQLAALACACSFSLAMLAGCGQPENNEAQAPASVPTETPSPTPNTPAMNTPATDAPVQDAAPTSTAGQPLNADKAEDLIENALEKDAALKFFDLDADDEGNTVVLKGKVQTKAQKDSAETIAKRTAPGVTIVNRITVG